MVPRDGTLVMLFVAVVLMVGLLGLSVFATVDFGSVSLASFRESVSAVLSTRIFNASDPVEEGGELIETQQPVAEDPESKNTDLVIDLDTFVPTADSFGFVAYPVITIEDPISLFAPGQEADEFRMSEAQIVERCAYISISYNRARCVRAERACAAVIGTSRDHLDCLKDEGFFGARTLRL